MHAVAGVKGAAGLEPSLEALNEVLGHERDVVLARSAPTQRTRSSSHTHFFPALQEESSQGIRNESCPTLLKECIWNLSII